MCIWEEYQHRERFHSGYQQPRADGETGYYRTCFGDVNEVMIPTKIEVKCWHPHKHGFNFHTCQFGSYYLKTLFLGLNPLDCGSFCIGYLLLLHKSHRALHDEVLTYLCKLGPLLLGLSKPTIASPISAIAISCFFYDLPIGLQ